jgi:hypothetical protein
MRCEWRRSTKKLKLVYTSSSHIVSLCNETTNDVSCERDRGEWEGGGERKRYKR